MSTVEHKKYIYHEDKYLQEILEYVDKTYSQHYSQSKYQATEFILDSGHGPGFCVGNIMKYAQRYGRKGDATAWRQDLLKVIHYALMMLYDHDAHDAKNPEPDKLTKAEVDMIKDAKWGKPAGSAKSNLVSPSYIGGGGEQRDSGYGGIADCDRTRKVYEVPWPQRTRDQKKVLDIVKKAYNNGYQPKTVHNVHLTPGAPPNVGSGGKLLAPKPTIINDTHTHVHLPGNEFPCTYTDFPYMYTGTDGHKYTVTITKQS